jgi:AmpD protein
MPFLAYNTISNGWWSAARRVPSPNFNDRPAKTEISLLVIHNISLPPGQFGGGYIEQFFTNELDPAVHPYFDSIAAMRVSAHCLIDRQGRAVQFVPFHQRAWHAGRSSYDGVVECNDYSVGIELEGADTLAYSAQQYQTLVKVTRDLIRHFPAMSPERITGHSDIAPGRKTDPGPAFDWALYRELLGKSMA